MKLLSIQIQWDLWSRLHAVLVQAEVGIKEGEARPTMRALVTSLIEDGLMHRKDKELFSLIRGCEVKRGRAPLAPDIKKIREEMDGPMTDVERREIGAYQQRTGKRTVYLAKWRRGEYK